MDGKDRTTELRGVSRKGNWFMDNSLSLVLAVMILVLIIFAGAKIYGYFTDRELKNAGEILDSVIGKVDALENGESNTFLFQGIKDWYLVGFDDKFKQENRPDKCFLDNCICICKDADESVLSVACQENGICKKVDKERIDAVTYFEKLAENRERVCIKMGSAVVPIFIEKKEDSLKLELVNGDELPEWKGAGLNVCYQ